MNFPKIFHANTGSTELPEFLVAKKQEIEISLSEFGALLFRGFSVNTAQGFQTALEKITPEPFDYRGGGSPRTKVLGKISTSTEYSARQSIPLHIEGSYFLTAPKFIWFYAQHPVLDRGNTPLGDMRKFVQSIDKNVVDEFVEKGLVYIANFHDGSGFGKSWQQAYGTNDKVEVSAYLKSRQSTYEWKVDGSLRVDLHAPAMRAHSETGDNYWCNQAQNWHPALQDSKTRQAAKKVYGDAVNFPKTVLFGDYSEISDSHIKHINEKLTEAEVDFDWQKNDVMLLDNQWISHGRQPFTDAARKILVSIA